MLYERRGRKIRVEEKCAIVFPNVLTDFVLTYYAHAEQMILIDIYDVGVFFFTTFLYVTLFFNYLPVLKFFLTKHYGNRVTLDSLYIIIII